MMRHYQYYARILKNQALPCAIVDIDLLRDNISQTVVKAGNKKIRPHTKALRCAAVTRMILDSNPKFSGLMCSSPNEAAYLSRMGFDDLVIAYPAFGEAALAAVCAELRKGKHITAVFDSEEHLSQYQKIASTHDVTLSMALDLDMAIRFPLLHFGVRWSTVGTPESARKLLKTIKTCPNLELVGILAYEAQVAGLPDKLPGQFFHNQGARLLKRLSASRITQRRKDVLRIISEEGLSVSFVNAGGTSSLEVTALDESVTEMSPGSAFLSPMLFDYFVGVRLQPAAFYAVEITRKAGNRLVCYGGGYNSPGVSDWSRSPVPYLPLGIKLTPTEGAGEVQTPLVYEGGEELSLGDPVFFRVSSAGMLAEHFNEFILVSDGKIVDRVPTYRGEGLCLA